MAAAGDGATDGCLFEDRIPPAIISTSEAGKFVAICKRTVAYIVGAVLFNSHGDILLVQEAKRSCRGRWYLPCGRLEPGETFEQGAWREVKEESGLDFIPTRIVCVEFGRAGDHWYRITFTGQVSGGKLKTKAEEDKESIQAAWFSWTKIRSGSVNIRSTDMLRLIEVSLVQKSFKPEESPIPLLPTTNPYRNVVIRFLLAHQDSETNEVKVFAQNQSSSLSNALVTCPVATHSVLKTIMNSLEGFFSANIEFSLLGLLAIEHFTRPNTIGRTDGCAFTILILVSGNKLPISKSTSLCWIDSEQFGARDACELRRRIKTPTLNTMVICT